MPINCQNTDISLQNDRKSKQLKALYFFKVIERKVPLIFVFWPFLLNHFYFFSDVYVCILNYNWRITNVIKITKITFKTQKYFILLPNMYIRDMLCFFINILNFFTNFCSVKHACLVHKVGMVQNIIFKGIVLFQIYTLL